MFNNPYPEGWQDSPSEETPITAAALQAHTDTIENLEEYLYENPIGGGSAVVEYGTTEDFEEKKDSYDVGTQFLITDDYDEGGGGGGASKASEVSFNNTETGMAANNVQDAIDEVFQSVSDGKSIVASAITDKGVPTLATDTFATMANNISHISGGGSNIYDMGYVVDENLILWVDGEFNDCDPTEHNNSKRLWCPRYFGNDMAFPIGELYNTPVWHDNCIEFVARSSQSAVRFNKTYPWSAKSGITCECLVEYANHSSGNNECFSQTESGGWLLGCPNGVGAYNIRLGSTTYVLNSPFNLELNKKYLLCGTYDVATGVQSFYINGQLVSSGQRTVGATMSNPSTNIWLGTDGAGSSPESNYNQYAMVGKVYSARLYDRALTPQEIANNYAIDSLRYGGE